MTSTSKAWPRPNLMQKWGFLLMKQINDGITWKNAIIKMQCTLRSRGWKKYVSWLWSIVDQKSSFAKLVFFVFPFVNDKCMMNGLLFSMEMIFIIEWKHVLLQIELFPKIHV